MAGLRWLALIFCSTVVLAEESSTCNSCMQGGKVVSCWRVCSTGCFVAFPDLGANGDCLQTWLDLQTGRARQDRFVFHQHEWTGGGKALGPFGRRHLEQLLPEVTQSGAYLSITSSGDDKLDQARRNALADSLAKTGVADATNRVRIAFPKAEGLYGDEALIAYPRLIMSGNRGGQGGQFGGGNLGGGAGGGLFGGGGGSVGAGARR